MPHLGVPFVELLELSAIFEHVAGFIFAIMFVDVEVYRAWPGQFVLDGGRGCLIVSAALPYLLGFPGVAVSAVGGITPGRVTPGYKG